MVWPFLILVALGAPPPDTPVEPEGRTRIHGVRLDPMPTAVLSRERLAETAGADLPSVLDSEPGLTVNRLGGLGMFSTVSIRGSTPEQVLIAFDGIPLNSADGAPVDLSTLPVGPLASVDVYRGRAPWSLGMTGLGGALVLHGRPVDELLGDAELVFGSFETAALRAFVGVPIPVGKGDDGIELALAIDGLHTASDYRFLNDGGTAWTRGDDRIDTRRNAEADQGSVLGRLSLRLGELRLTLLELHTGVSRGLPSLGVTPTRASTFSLSRDLVALRLDARPGAFVVSAGAWLALTASEVLDPLGEIGLTLDRSRTRSTVPGAILTVRLPTAPTPRLRLVPSMHLTWRLEASSGTRLEAVERHIASLGAELAFRHALSARRDAAVLELEAGLRGELAWEPTHGASPSGAATSLAAYLEGALALAEIRLSLGARLAPRLPSLFELHGDTGLALGNAELDPETASTFEVGARWEPTIGEDKPLAASLMAYLTLASELIQFVQNAQGITRPENLASARILGLEAQVEARLFDSVHVRSSIALMRAVDRSDIAARAGNLLPLRPTLATSHRIELRTADAGLGEERGMLGLYLELDHVAGSHLDFANLVATPPRTLLGAGAFVRATHAEVVLSVSNILSDRVQDLAGYPLPGLTAMLSLRLETSRR